MSRVFAAGLLLLFAGSPVQASVILNQGFDNISTLAGSGWAMTNNSSPAGTTSWFQGNPVIFSSQAGAPDAYIAANFNNAASPGNISDWLLTPVVSLQYNLQFVFYTRTEANSTFPDRLELRLSTSGSSTNVGSSDSSVGDFTNLVLTVNPTLSVGGYPSDWTQFTANFIGLGVPASGRFAFRYYVPDTVNNADYIGIDTVSITQDVPEPATMALFALGFGAIAWRRLRRANQLQS
jgi:hypothetical protein